MEVQEFLDQFGKAIKSDGAESCKILFERNPESSKDIKILNASIYGELQPLSIYLLYKRKHKIFRYLLEQDYFDLLKTANVEEVRRLFEVYNINTIDHAAQNTKRIVAKYFVNNLEEFASKPDREGLKLLEFMGWDNVKSMIDLVGVEFITNIVSYLSPNELSKFREQIADNFLNPFVTGVEVAHFLALAQNQGTALCRLELIGGDKLKEITYTPASLEIIRFSLNEEGQRTFETLSEKTFEEDLQNIESTRAHEYELYLDVYHELQNKSEKNYRFRKKAAEFQSLIESFITDFDSMMKILDCFWNKDFTEVIGNLVYNLIRKHVSNTKQIVKLLNNLFREGKDTPSLQKFVEQLGTSFITSRLKDEEDLLYFLSKNPYAWQLRPILQRLPATYVKTILDAAKQPGRIFSLWLACLEREHRIPLIESLGIDYVLGIILSDAEKPELIEHIFYNVAVYTIWHSDDELKIKLLAMLWPKHKNKLIEYPKSLPHFIYAVSRFDPKKVQELIESFTVPLSAEAQNDFYAQGVVYHSDPNPLPLFAGDGKICELTTFCDYSLAHQKGILNIIGLTNLLNHLPIKYIKSSEFTQNYVTNSERLSIVINYLINKRRLDLNYLAQCKQDQLKELINIDRDKIITSFKKIRFFDSEPESKLCWLKQKLIQDHKKSDDPLQKFPEIWHWLESDYMQSKVESLSQLHTILLAATKRNMTSLGQRTSYDFKLASILLDKLTHEYVSNLVTNTGEMKDKILFIQFMPRSIGRAFYKNMLSADIKLETLSTFLNAVPGIKRTDVLLSLNLDALKAFRDWANKNSTPQQFEQQVTRVIHYRERFTTQKQYETYNRDWDDNKPLSININTLMKRISTAGQRFIHGNWKTHGAEVATELMTKVERIKTKDKLIETLQQKLKEIDKPTSPMKSTGGTAMRVMFCLDKVLNDQGNILTPRPSYRVGRQY